MSRHMNHAPKRAPRHTPPRAPQVSNDTPDFPMRINKYLAVSKFSTRRGADVLIKQKLVFINGRVALLGDQVHATDTVEVKRTGKEKPLVYYAYNKPRGVLTHATGGNENDIPSTVDLKGVFPVGRLDKDSHGLIILTNDGRITERLLHPRFEHEKEYLVTTKENLRSSFKSKMEAGVRIENETTKPCKVKLIDERTFRVTLTEGKKHQVRRMCVALFQEVKDLKRIRVMNIELGKVADGHYRPIEGAELEKFLEALDLR